jgi:signal transduction histidine kinase
LVVDDNEQNRYLLRALLLGHGYDVRTADNGVDALAQAGREPPDLVISDILMPGMDGFALCRRWKADPVLRAVPFVFYTATYTSAADERFALGLGADRFIVKPAEPGEFMRIIAEVLDAHEGGRLRAQEAPAAPETQYLRDHNAALVRKLERKVEQLAEANRTLAAKEALNQAVLDATASPMAVVGLRGDVLSVNRAWAHLACSERAPKFLALAAGDNALVGPYCGQATANPTLARLCEGLRAVLDGEREVELDLPCGSADAHWFLVRIEKVGVAGAGALIACIDMTDRLRAEAALREAAQRKDAFLALLGHELRNPLAPIKTASHILKRLQLGDPRAERAREIIERQTAQLARMVDDLLDVSRIQRSKLAVASDVVDWREVVRTSAEDVRPGFAIRGLELRLDVPAQPLWLRGDAGRLSQVVGNLLDNASKFSERGGRVEVRLAAEDASWSRLEVRDTGAGMDAETLARAFQPFEQAPQGSARTRGGLGLGLALIKGIVELHGGQVSAHSPGPGQGSMFVVRLPLTEAPPLRESPAETERADGARVLVIEDNRDAAAAYDGTSGLERARAWSPDTVLCDIGLPGALDGYGVAQAMRADPALRATRLVALTGYGQASDRRRAEEAGFDAHVTKPADPQALLRLVMRSAPGREDGDGGAMARRSAGRKRAAVRE